MSTAVAGLVALRSLSAGSDYTIRQRRPAKYSVALPAGARQVENGRQSGENFQERFQSSRRLKIAFHNKELCDFSAALMAARPTRFRGCSCMKTGTRSLTRQGEISFIQNTEFRCTLRSVSASLFQKAAMISLRPQNDPEGRIP